MFEALPRLHIKLNEQIDFHSSKPEVLWKLAQDAESTLNTVLNGLGAIGQLLAHSSIELEDGTIGADSLESLGFLMSELGDLAASCMTLSAACRRAHATSPYFDT
ncbi:conserved hypothetical protein [Burkholderiales bacterium 8X]|nr:conserved hypothetical protein [Burkholderiales bacterium 8X]